MEETAVKDLVTTTNPWFAPPKVVVAEPVASDSAFPIPSQG
jgi:hypothetical protein